MQYNLTKVIKHTKCTACNQPQVNSMLLTKQVITDLADFLRHLTRIGVRSHLRCVFFVSILSTFFVNTAVAEADLSQVPSGNYAVDPTHAYLQFQYNHLGLSNPILTFDDFSINMMLDNADPAKSRVEVEIDVNSIQTGSDIWYQHLVGSDWFDTANNPTIIFNSTTIEGSGASYTVTGDLTIKGKTHPATLNVTINAATTHPLANKPVIGFSADGKLLRSNWNLGKSVPFVSDEVTLQIEAELFPG